MNLATLLGQSLVSKETAIRINLELKTRGVPTENRLIILNPKEMTGRTASGLIIPKEVSEGIPKKGVLVQMGEITEEYRSYTNILDIGSILTYGLYAGKEIEPLEPLDIPGFNQDKHELRVISVSEIMYIEYAIKIENN